MDSKNSGFITVGFDPGGARKFGWALIHWRSREPEPIQDGDCGIASSAQSALNGVKKRLGNRRPNAIGIDAPLYWVNGDVERVVDRKVREALHGKTRRSVNHVNSLRGGCLAQGMMLAHLALRSWPRALITETHPAALSSMYRDAPAHHRSGAAGHTSFLEWCALARRGIKEHGKLPISKGGNLAASQSEKLPSTISLHEIDALLGAVAAGIGWLAIDDSIAHDSEWADLVTQEDEESSTRFFPWTNDSRELHYYFPLYQQAG